MMTHRSGGLDMSWNRLVALLLVVLLLYMLLMYFPRDEVFRVASLGPIVITNTSFIPPRNDDFHVTSNSTDNITIQGKPFRDEFFEPILDTFRCPSKYALQTTFRSGFTPKVFFISSFPLSGERWKEPFAQFYEDQCPLPCKITDNVTEIASADAILVFLTELNSTEQIHKLFPQRDLTQPWIAMATECPVTGSSVSSYRSLNAVFNRTMYFRRDSDILMAHGFIVPKEDARYLPQSYHSDAPPIKKLPFDQRKMAVAFIGNCWGRDGRLDYIVELSKYVRVDLIGNCALQKCGKPIGEYWVYNVEEDECLLGAAQQYLFYLSFENNIAEDYVTEKVYNILYYPVVPVVFGGADYTKVLPPNSYINALHYTPQNLSSRLQHLAANQEEYEAMLSWREDYEVSTVATRRVLCQLCTRLYDPKFYELNVYYDFYDWYVTKSKSNRRYSKELNKFTHFKETDKKML